MEFENDNQIVEETISDQVIETPEDEFQQTEIEETPATTQEDFFEVKYNKENMKISRDEAPTYIQKGLNYDKVNQKATDYEQHLQRVAQITGYQSIDELIQASQQFEEQQRVQQEAQRLGMDEQSYMQYIAPVNNELQTLRGELQNMKFAESQRQVEREINDLKSRFDDFEQYEDKIFDLAINRGYTLEDAYKLASFEDKISNVQKQTEQRVVDQIKARQGKHVETHDENAKVSLNLSPEEVAYAQRMGIAPEEYAKWKG